jgi:Molecular chaperone GrpE (heat shock protein)
MTSAPNNKNESDQEEMETGSNDTVNNHPNSKEPPVEPVTPPKEAPRTPKNVTITDIELEHLKKELAEYKDKYLRVLAESENSRKRLQKEKQEMIQYARQSVVVDFLNPIDHMENALKFTQQMSDDVKHWALGFQMILSQFKDVLTNNGVTPFVSEGRPFDPHRHEAVETVPTNDVQPGTVLEESLRGYIMGDKVVRPARVKVSKAIINTAEDNISDAGK